MGPPKRAQTRRREERIWELSVAGHSLRQIATALAAEGLGPISHVGVMKALRRVEARVLADLCERARVEVAHQVARLDYLYGQALRGWERSQEPAKVARETRKPGDPPPAVPGQAAPRAAPDRVETTHEVRGRDGDPRFLAEARAALGDSRKLLDLDAPERYQVGGLAGREPVGVDLSRLPEADLLALHEILGRAEARDEAAIRPGHPGASNGRG